MAVHALPVDGDVVEAGEDVVEAVGVADDEAVVDDTVGDGEVPTGVRLLGTDRRAVYHTVAIFP